jgi:hypothetical protein
LSNKKESLKDVERHLTERLNVEAEKDGTIYNLRKSVSHILHKKMLTHPCLTADEEDFESE